jgi:hypothetical protein
MAATRSAGTEAVLGALSGQPGRTAAEIALAAGIGRSTANKALAALEADGKALRAAGGRDGARPQPDRWSLPPKSKSPRSRAKAATGEPRLGKGELTGLVLKHLRPTGTPTSPRRRWPTPSEGAPPGRWGMRSSDSSGRGTR